MTKIGKMYFSLLFLFAPLLAMAEGVSVIANVDRNQVFVGDTFTLTVSVSSESSVAVQDPRLPSLNDFDVLNSWASSQTQSTFANGKFQVKRSKLYNYLMAPRKVGSSTLGSFVVNVEGQEYRTNPIQITVKKGNAPQQNQPRGIDLFDDDVDDIFSQLLRRRGVSRDSVEESKKDINTNDYYFLDVVVNKKEVYVGEQVTASWYIYTRQNLTDIQNIKFPDLKGFWKEDIEVATGLRFTSEVVNGVMYKKALLASYALFPIKVGTSKVDSYKVKCKFMLPGILGFKKSDYITRGSGVVNIKVKPLPVAGKPSDFTGAVGEFSIQSSADKKQVKQNQPIVLKIRFEGIGNAKRINLPKFEFPEGLELYDTKSKSKYYKSGKSYKEFELLIIPRKAGEQVVPELTVSLFNPKTGKYYQKSTPMFKINVKPAEEGLELAEERYQDVAPGADLIKPKGPVEPELVLSFSDNTNQLKDLNFILWLVALVGVLLYLIWYFIHCFEVFSTKHNLQVEVKKRISTLQGFALKQDWRSVGVEGANLIYLLLGKVSGQGGGSEQAQKLIEMAPPSIRKEFGSDIVKLLSQFETLGFAQEEVVGKYKDVKELKSLVTDLDQLLKKVVELYEVKGES